MDGSSPRTGADAEGEDPPVALEFGVRSSLSVVACSCLVSVFKVKIKPIRTNIPVERGKTLQREM